MVTTRLILRPFPFDIKYRKKQSENTTCLPTPRSFWWTDKQTNKQTNERTNEQTNKRTSKRTDSQTNEQTNEHTSKHIHGSQLNCFSSLIKYLQKSFQELLIF